MIIKVKAKTSPYDWHTAFAWRPELVGDGIKVWMQRYERRFLGSTALFKRYEQRIPGSTESATVVYRLGLFE